MVSRTRKGRMRRNGIAYTILILAVAATLLPMLWTIATSFKPPEEYFTRPPRLVSNRPTLQHYRDLFVVEGLQKNVLNSIEVAIVTTVVTVAVGAVGAYSLSRFGAGGRFFKIIVLIQRMAPPVAIAIPLFILNLKLGLLDKWLGLAFTHISMNVALAFWLLIGFFQEIPIDLDEAAMIDGCTRLRTLRSILLPLLAPGLSATAVLVAMMSWNEFFFAVVMTRTAASQTLPVAVSSFVIPSTGFEWGKMAAGGVIAIVPMFFVVLFAQRYLVRGLTGGAVKG